MGNVECEGIPESEKAELVEDDIQPLASLIRAMEHYRAAVKVRGESGKDELGNIQRLAPQAVRRIANYL